MQPFVVNGKSWQPLLAESLSWDLISKSILISDFCPENEGSFTRPIGSPMAPLLALVFCKTPWLVPSVIPVSPGCDRWDRKFKVKWLTNQSSILKYLLRGINLEMNISSSDVPRICNLNEKVTRQTIFGDAQIKNGSLTAHQLLPHQGSLLLDLSEGVLGRLRCLLVGAINLNGVSSINTEHDERKSINNKRRPLQAVALILAGLVFLCYSSWNLYFRSDLNVYGLLWFALVIASMGILTLGVFLMIE